MKFVFDCAGLLSQSSYYTYSLKRYLMRDRKDIIKLKDMFRDVINAAERVEFALFLNVQDCEVA